jgi:DNA-binding transcriptional ArsR family regulator
MPRSRVDLDRTFQALADPTRRGMVERLSFGQASVSELARPYAMSLPAITQHLAMLEHSGLVSSDKIGRVRTFRMVPATLSLAENWFNQRRAQWEQRLDRLDEHLKRFPQGEPE